MQEPKLKDGFKSSRYLPVEIEGVTKTLGEWADTCGVEYSIIKTRYIRGDRGDRLVRNARGYRGFHDQD